MKRFLSLILLVLFGVCGYSQTYTKRVALLIGNSSYQNGGVLTNPVNDVRAMNDLLKSLGFEVIKIENATQTQMKQAINSFGLKIKDYDVGLFYYAGHGIQNKGVNYMIPIEADLTTEEQIEFDCVSADRILAYMENATTKINLIIMDACRNNPFERSWARSAAGGGLALMNAPKGTLIAYATSPGKVASDGTSGNGLYTSALLRHLKDPGLNIEQVFKKVRTEVSEKSFGTQIPWETTSLTGADFFFSPDRNNTEVVTDNIGNTTNTGGGGVRSIETVDNDEKLTSYSKATDLYEQKKYAEAIVYYTKAIKADPNYAEAMLWRAHSYYASQKYAEAILDYNKSISLNPGEAQAYYYRGLCKYNLQRNAEAISDFSLTIKYDPNYTNAYYWRGYCYYVQQKYFAALEDYNKTIEISPDYSEVYYFRGLNYYDTKEYQKSYDDLVTLLRLDPNYLQGIRLKGHAEYMLANYADADRTYTQFLAKTPDDAEIWYWKAYANLNLNRRDEAKRAIDRAIKLKPDNADYLKFRNETLAN